MHDLSFVSEGELFAVTLETGYALKQPFTMGCYPDSVGWKQNPTNSGSRIVKTGGGMARRTGRTLSDYRHAKVAKTHSFIP